MMKISRRKFIAASTVSLASLYTFAKANKSHQVANSVFIGHGSPLNAIELNVFSKKQIALTHDIMKPSAVLVVSAHWETEGLFLNKVDTPRTIHDFGGFPQALQEYEYKTSGKTKLIEDATVELKNKNIQINHTRGLDHGAWSVLCRLFPKGDVPSFQMSINKNKSLIEHLEIAQELKSLRKKNLMILGSGNVVHNLRVSDDSKNFKVFDWAMEFDSWLSHKIENKDFKGIARFEGIDPKIVKLAHPTLEHFIPVLYTLGASEMNEKIKTPITGFQESAISMKSLIIS